MCPLNQEILSLISDIDDKYVEVDKSIVQAMIARIWERFFDLPELKTNPVGVAYFNAPPEFKANLNITFYDIEGKDESTIIGILCALGISPDEPVMVIWIANRQGIKLPYRVFCKFIDELYYPAADDIWVTDYNLSWLVEIDHEEIIRFITDQ